MEPQEPTASPAETIATNVHQRNITQTYRTARATLAPTCRSARWTTPAKHFSGRSPFDLDRRLWGGLYVHAPAGGIYYAGDSGYCTHFRDIRERLGSPRVALLPIGAFEPRWFMSPVHMDPAQAVQAHLDLGAVTSVAVHYGSFALADDEQGQPERELTAALRAQRVPESRFRILPHGDAVGLPRGVAELGVDAVA